LTRLFLDLLKFIYVEPFCLDIITQKPSFLEIQYGRAALNLLFIIKRTENDLLRGAANCSGDIVKALRCQTSAMWGQQVGSSSSSFIAKVGHWSTRWNGQRRASQRTMGKEGGGLQEGLLSTPREGKRFGKDIEIEQVAGSGSFFPIAFGQKS
jgi:hypothetical protein